jgi:hypothetical protein
VDKEIVYALVNKAWQAVTMKDNVRSACRQTRVQILAVLDLLRFFLKCNRTNALA